MYDRPVATGLRNEVSFARSYEELCRTPLLISIASYFLGCGADILINIFLWILGWIPGVIHAWWVLRGLAVIPAVDESAG